MLKGMLFVAIGGGVGSACRYLCSLLINKYTHSIFPIATFAVNILGCFAIGCLLGYFIKTGSDNHNLKLLLATGFCGGYTTFSAFSLESLTLFQSGHTFQALSYVVGSILLGLLSVWGGFALLR